MFADQFVAACKACDESEARTLYERDVGILNVVDRAGGFTPLMASLFPHESLPNITYSISRWLLSLPGLDPNICDGNNRAALQFACMSDQTPLDVLIHLVKLTSWQTINMREYYGHTALDMLIQYNDKNHGTSAALYLSWLGAECKEENRKYREVSLQSWLEAGRHQDAQYWAVAANDINALKILESMKNVRLDRGKLRSLARLFDHREVWSYVTSLASLAWEEVEQSIPAMARLPPPALLAATPPGQHSIVKVVCSYRQDLTKVQRNLLGLK